MELTLNVKRCRLVVAGIVLASLCIDAVAIYSNQDNLDFQQLEFRLKAGDNEGAKELAARIIDATQPSQYQDFGESEILATRGLRIADTYARNGLYFTALPYYDVAIRTLSANKLPEVRINLARAHAGRSNVYIAMRQYGQAEESLKIAGEVIFELATVEQAIENVQFLKIEVGFMWTELMAETGRYEEVFENHDQTAKLFQSLVEIEKPQPRNLEESKLVGLFSRYVVAEKAYATALFESGRYFESLQRLKTLVLYCDKWFSADLSPRDGVMVNLTSVHLSVGELSEAHNILRQLLGRIDEDGSNVTPLTAAVFNNLGNYYSLVEQPKLALDAYIKAIELQVMFDITGASRIDVLLNIAALKIRLNDADAIDILRTAFVQSQEQYPLRAITALMHMGRAYYLSGDLEKSAAMATSALQALRENKLTANSRFHENLVNLAMVKFSLGEVGSAVELLEQSAKSTYYVELALLEKLILGHHKNGDDNRAQYWSQRTIDELDRSIRAIRFVGDASWRDTLLLRLAESRNRILTHATERSEVDRDWANNMVANLTLRLKANNFETYDAGDPKDGDNDERHLLAEEIAHARARITQGLSGNAPTDQPNYRESRKNTDQLNKLESKLASLDRSQKVKGVNLDPQSVSDTLEPNTLLIDYHVFTPIEFGLEGVYYGWGKPRLIAVRYEKGELPEFIDLGELAPLQVRIESYIAHLEATSKTPSARSSDGEELYRALVSPVVGRLEPSLTELIMSPDGPLHRLPFAALRIGDRYLVQKVGLRYVTSPRVLLAKHGPTTAARSPATVVGLPDFEKKLDGNSPNPSEGVVSSLHDESPIRIADIIGVSAPGWFARRLINGKFYGTVSALGLLPEGLLLGDSASETRVKDLTGPSILHLSTHGMASLPVPKSDTNYPIGSQPANRQQEIQAGQWALANSHVALAGYSNGKRGNADDDGMLTAKELADIDLAGTQLATLAACDAGTGKTISALGIYGLRSALEAAGAQTQLLALWKVNEELTGVFMVNFYTAYMAGKTPSQALRKAQLAVLDSETQGPNFPHHWAAFVVSGHNREYIAPH